MAIEKIVNETLPQCPDGLSYRQDISISANQDITN